MFPIPEMGPGGEQTQKDLLDGILCVSGRGQPGHGDPQQGVAVFRYDPANVFIGTKRTHLLNSFHL